VSIKFKIIDKDTIELLEDAKKGDIILLSNSDTIQLDKKTIEDLHKKTIDNAVETKIKKLEAEILAQKERELSLQKQLFEQQAKSNSLKESEQLKKKINELESQIKIKEHDLQNINSQKENEIKVAESKIKEKMQEELNKAKKEAEFQAELVKRNQQEYEKQLNHKLQQNVKTYGEELENFIYESWKEHEDMYSNVSFIKDNEVVEGTKGDFVYRETNDNGDEILSIMFECKNETLNSTHKKTNSSHYEKLENDRKKKNCMYSVLITELEKDKEITVLTDKQYPNMFVIRPSGFWAIIKFLRSLVKKNSELVLQLQQAKSQHTDIENFEEKLLDFKDSVKDSVIKYKNNHDEAIEQIDKSIAALQKTREKLLMANKHLGTLDNKVETVTIRKLAGSQEKFNEMKEKARGANDK